MKLYKYNEFKLINENMDKSRKFLKERDMLLKASNELGLVKGELLAKLKNKEIKSVTINDFTPSEQDLIRKKMNDIKLTPEEIKMIERNSDLNDIKSISTNVGGKGYQLEKDNVGWLYMFTYLYYNENISKEELSNLYKRLIENREFLGDLPVMIDGDIVQKKFDLSFMNEKITNNAELLTDALDRLDIQRKVKKVEIALTPELRASLKSASNIVKDKFAEIASAFTDLSYVDGVLNDKNYKKLWSFFGGMGVDEHGKKKYMSQLKRYDDISKFIKAAQNHIKSIDNDSAMLFYDKINDVNTRYGQLGANVEFEDGGILIIEVKSFAANQILNSHTSHCIKDSLSSWNSYVDDYNNKQYYIYNFNLPQYDNDSTIGITIEPGHKIKSCHNKPDHNIASSIKSILKKWEKEYDIDADLWSILKPMTPAEIEQREKAKIANREIVKKGISIEDINRLVKIDGADVNKNNAIALTNAVEENDFDKVKLLIELGINSNLRKGRDSAISRAKSIDIIKLLIENGAMMSGDLFSSVISDINSLKYCLDAGLDPDFNHGMPLRAAARGTYKKESEIGESYTEQFKLLVKYGAKIINSDGSCDVLKWLCEFGRVDLLEYVYSLPVKPSQKDTKLALNLVTHSRKLDQDIVKRMSDILERNIA